MSIDGKRRLAAAGFVTLLMLSVFWPSPVVGINRICCNAPLGVDELSFLGREAPAWDVVFWCISGLFALALLHDAQDFSPIPAEFRATRLRVSVAIGIGVIASAAIVAVIWIYADAPVSAWSERVNSDRVEGWIRIANRFGGGMNPVMVILFFALAGVAYAKREWVGLRDSHDVRGRRGRGDRAAREVRGRPYAAGIVARTIPSSAGVGKLISERPHGRRIRAGGSPDPQCRIENVARDCGTAGILGRTLPRTGVPSLDFGCDRVGGDRTAVGGPIAPLPPGEGAAKRRVRGTANTAPLIRRFAPPSPVGRRTGPVAATLPSPRSSR